MFAKMQHLYSYSQQTPECNITLETNDIQYVINLHNARYGFVSSGVAIVSVKWRGAGPATLTTNHTVCIGQLGIMNIDAFMAVLYRRLRSWQNAKTSFDETE